MRETATLASGPPLERPLRPTSWPKPRADLELLMLGLSNAHVNPRRAKARTMAAPDPTPAVGFNVLLESTCTTSTAAVQALCRCS